MNDIPPRPPAGTSGLDVEAELLLRLARPGETREAALERLARLCACCHRVYQEERLTRHVCERCHAHVRCGHCQRDFEPGPGTFALLCPDCWPAVQRLVRTMHELESPDERAELRHQMRLAFEPRSACRWREDGRARGEPAGDGR